MNINQVERIRPGKGFLAALDQSYGRANGRVVQRNARGIHYISQQSVISYPKHTSSKGTRAAMPVRLFWFS